MSNRFISLFCSFSVDYIPLAGEAIDTCPHKGVLVAILIVVDVKPSQFSRTTDMLTHAN